MKSAILMFVLFALPLQGQKPSTIPSPDQGRYQLLPVTLAPVCRLWCVRRGQKA